MRKLFVLIFVMLANTVYAGDGDDIFRLLYTFKDIGHLYSIALDNTSLVNEETIGALRFEGGYRKYGCEYDFLDIHTEMENNRIIAGYGCGNSEIVYYTALAEEDNLLKCIWMEYKPNTWELLFIYKRDCSK